MQSHLGQHMDFKNLTCIKILFTFNNYYQTKFKKKISLTVNRSKQQTIWDLSKILR